MRDANNMNEWVNTADSHKFVHRTDTNLPDSDDEHTIVDVEHDIESNDSQLRSSPPSTSKPIVRRRSSSTPDIKPEKISLRKLVANAIQSACASFMAVNEKSSTISDDWYTQLGNLYNLSIECNHVINSGLGVVATCRAVPEPLAKKFMRQIRVLQNKIKEEAEKMWW